jgi:hypothetical protein
MPHSANLIAQNAVNTRRFFLDAMRDRGPAPAEYPGAIQRSP